MSSFTARYRVTRADLVRYAGSSGDFNPIHYSDRIATQMGLIILLMFMTFVVVLDVWKVTGH